MNIRPTFDASCPASAPAEPLRPHAADGAADDPFLALLAGLLLPPGSAKGVVVPTDAGVSPGAGVMTGAPAVALGAPTGDAGGATPVDMAPQSVMPDAVVPCPGDKASDAAMVADGTDRPRPAPAPRLRPHPATTDDIRPDRAPAGGVTSAHHTVAGIVAGPSWPMPAADAADGEPAEPAPAPGAAVDGPGPVRTARTDVTDKPVERAPVTTTGPIDQHVRPVSARLLASTTIDGQRLHIQLEPVDLGRVEVRLRLDQTGTAGATFIVDRPETLLLLQRDARVVTDLLAAAGFTVEQGGIGFTLRDGHTGGQGGSPSAPPTWPTAALRRDPVEGEAVAPRPARRGLLDLHV